MDDTTDSSRASLWTNIRSHILTHWKPRDLVLAAYPTITFVASGVSLHQGTGFVMTLTGVSGCLSAIVVLDKLLASHNGSEDSTSSQWKIAGASLIAAACALRGTDSLELLPPLFLAHGTQMLAVGLLKNEDMAETVDEGTKQSET